MRTTVRRLAATLAAAAGVATLAACGTLPADTDPVAVAEATPAATYSAPTSTYRAPTTTTSPAAPGEDMLIAVLDAQGIDYGSEAVVIDTGYKACRALDGGMSVAGLGLTAIGEGIEAETAGSLIAAWVYTLCPEHTAELEAFAADYGN